MKVVIFDTHRFEKDYLKRSLEPRHEIRFLDVRLTEATANLAQGAQAVVVFVNDDLSRPVLKSLMDVGIRFITTRSAGFNHIDLVAAKEFGLQVTNVPDYSPHAVAEHSIALMLALNRKLIRADHRIHDLNFSLEGLIGFDMHGKKVGVIGLGKIGRVVAKILHGFGCSILGYDLQKDLALQEECSIAYRDLSSLLREADIVTLHLPLTRETHHLIQAETIASMKPGVMLINTSRGALVKTRDVIQALKSGHIGYLGMDVYEEEKGLFFEDHSEDILKDDQIARLMTFPNVLITSHQAFLTQEALEKIASVTAHNLDCFERGELSENLLPPTTC